MGMVLLSGVSVRATALLSNHFTGNSGGVPAGWSDVGDTSLASTVVESGTTVAITDTRGAGGPQFLVSPFFGGIDDFQLNLDISLVTGAIQGQPEIMAGLGGQSGYTFITKFNTVTKTFGAVVLGPTMGSITLPGGPHLPSFSGRAFSYSISGDTDSFRITSPLDTYDSGDILFSAIGAAGFDSVHDLGSMVAMIMGTESGGSVPEGTLATVAFDQVGLTGTLTESQTAEAPEASTYAAGLAVLGMLGSRWWRNRSAATRIASHS